MTATEYDFPESAVLYHAVQGVCEILYVETVTPIQMIVTNIEEFILLVLLRFSSKAAATKCRPQVQDRVQVTVLR